MLSWSWVDFPPQRVDLHGAKYSRDTADSTRRPGYDYHAGSEDPLSDKVLNSLSYRQVSNIGRTNPNT